MVKHRKPIAAVMTDYGWLVVICDDGSLWRRINLSAEDSWSELTPAIPGSAAAAAEEVDSDAVAEFAGTFR